MEFLLFRLYGQLCSWGPPAVGERRATEAYPSRSAVLGLVAAALGICREDEAQMAKLFGQLSFGVMVNNSGHLLRDYHTAQVPPARSKQRLYTRSRELLDKNDLKTILSGRDYRTDAVYTIALWNRTDAQSWSLEEIANAIRNPRFVLYLGRKSCPVSLPLTPKVVIAKNLRQAFLDVTFPCDRFISSLLPNSESRFYWERLDSDAAGMAPDIVRLRRDDPGSRTRWQFQDRAEFEHISSNEENLDVLQPNTVTV